MLDQIMLYVRENTMVTAMAAGVSILFLLLLVRLQEQDGKYIKSVRESVNILMWFLQRKNQSRSL